MEKTERRVEVTSPAGNLKLNGRAMYLGNRWLTDNLVRLCRRYEKDRDRLLEAVLHSSLKKKKRGGIKLPREPRRNEDGPAVRGEWGNPGVGGSEDGLWGLRLGSKPTPFFLSPV